MKKALCILISCYLLLLNVCVGQCPEREFLWKRLIFLRESGTLVPQEQLHELLKYEDALKTCSYRNDSTHAFLLQRIGAAYYKLANFLKAIQYTRLSINIINANRSRPSINYRHVIKSYYNLSVFYESLKMSNERNMAVDSCVSIAIRFKAVEQSYLFLLSQKTDFLFNIGEYNRSYTYATLGEEATKHYTHGTDSLLYDLSFFNRKVNILLLYKNYDSAEKLLIDKLNQSKNSSSKEHIANIYSLSAVVQIQKGNYHLSLKYLKKAFQLYSEAKDNVGCMQTLTSLGYYLYFQQDKDIKKALLTYKKALTYEGKNNSGSKSEAFESLNILANMANAFVAERSYDSAYYYFQLAFNKIKLGSNENDLLYSSLDSLLNENNIEYLFALVIDKADAHLTQYKMVREESLAVEAIKIYKVADRLLNRIKVEQSETQSKLFWRSNSRRLYEHAIEACYRANFASDAFYFFEKSRAVLLNDQLNEQRWTGDNDIMQQKQIKQEILRQERALDALSSSSPKYTELQNELVLNKQKLDNLFKIIKVRNPVYYQTYIDTTFITPADVSKHILKGRDALIEFFVGDSNVYVITITAKASSLSLVDKAEYQRLVSLYVSYISDDDLMNLHFKEFATVSRSLYQLIFKSNKLPATCGRLVISPDNRYFPFEALITSSSGQAPAYFLESYAVSYVYSARYLLNQFNSTTSTSSLNFLGIAPVQYDTSFHLPDLQGSDLSVKKICSFFDNADVLLNKATTKNNFLQNFANYKIVQLYTHASDSGNTGEPVIYFSDSALYLSDLIQEKRPVTDLIILSACETANGKIYQGEGVFSFNRAFAGLGIPSSVVNLWVVDNQSTYQITERFCKYLAQGIPTDVALQKAKLDFIHAGSLKSGLAYYWAAPILTGKTEAIRLQKAFPWKVSLGLASLIGLALLWKRRKFFHFSALLTKIAGG